jgi:hypothetical protein
MKMNKKVVAVLALVALVFGAGIALAQVTPLGTDTYGRFLGNGPAPALSACGTAPLIAGTDTAGTITIGTGTPTACTLTFNRAFPGGAPACYFNDQTTAGKTNAGTTYLVSSTTAAVTVTFQAATVNGDVIQYGCLGR